jgi:hypothetical protein
MGATPPLDWTTPTEALRKFGRGELVGEQSGVDRLSERKKEIIKTSLPSQKPFLIDFLSGQLQFVPAT